jgi:osmotically-inducible protein OsmY
MSLLVLILFILILLGGLPHSGQHSYGSRPPGLTGMLDVARAVPARTTPADAWSTTKTRLALLTTEGVSRMAIKMDTWDGVAPLCGIGPAQEATAAAEAAARKLSGVHKRVETEGEVLDEEVEREMKKTYDTPHFKDIIVEVRNGVVWLTGTVPSWAWHLEAVAVARATPGVRAVEDNLHLMLVM